MIHTHTHNGTLAIKKNEVIPLSYMDATRDEHNKQSKKERQIPYDVN